MCSSTELQFEYLFYVLYKRVYNLSIPNLCILAVWSMTRVYICSCSLCAICVFLLCAQCQSLQFLNFSCELYDKSLQFAYAYCVLQVSIYCLCILILCSLTSLQLAYPYCVLFELVYNFTVCLLCALWPEFTI